MKLNVTEKIALIAVSGFALASFAVAGTHNGNGALHSAGHGNSAFGHKQGNSATRTKGVQNSQFGRNKAAAAKPSPTP
jgi:hypothetical protein